MAPPALSASAALRARARAVMPGGVSSPVRAFRAVGGEPPLIVRGQGAHVWDADGRRFIDLVCSWGPLIAGHTHPRVVAAIARQAERGTSYGMPSPLEAELAEVIVSAFPRIEMIRFVSSGTEAAMSAIRLARAATGREAILKFAGGYHGHADALLAKAGSGLATFGLPDSAGVPAAVARDTLTVVYNDLRGARRAASDRDLAAIIVEPVAGNIGVVPPAAGFLDGLRALTQECGALLIFDEVITGFRVARGGAQERYGVEADITCLGKIIGGGLPVGAYGASRELMRLVAPEGPVYQAGTLSGNPLAMAAGIATCELLGDPAYARLEALGARLGSGLARAAAEAEVPAHVQRVGSLLTLFFTEREVRNEQEALATDRGAFARFHQAMFRRGVLLPPSALECVFVSLAHDEAILDEVASAAADALTEIAA
jgi:glutamate-1-semialdehyde 2,1-aminomutase